MRRGSHLQVWGVRALTGMKVLAILNAVAAVPVLAFLTPTYVRQRSWGDLTFVVGITILTFALAYGMIVGADLAIRRIRSRSNSN